MPIPEFSVIPNSVTNPGTFGPDMDQFLSEFPAVIEAMNAIEVAGTLSEVQATSSSSVAVGTGAKSFTVQAGKSFVAGMWLMIADTAAPTTNTMVGQVTSYSGTSLVMDIKAVTGSGTKSAWTISQSAPTTAVLEHIATYTPSGVASVEFAVPAGYAELIFMLQALRPATDSVNLWMQASNDSVPNYGQTISLVLKTTNAAGNAITTGLTSSATAPFGSSIGNAAGRGISGTISVQVPDDAAVRKFGKVNLSFMDNTGALRHAEGTFTVGTAAWPYVRFLFSSGNIQDGEILVYGVKK